MRTKHDVIKALIDPGIIAIIRTPSPNPIPQTCEALLKGGVTAIEITLTVPNALEALRRVRARFADRIVLGAGTILNAGSCRDAITAGAEYIVTPVTKEEIIRAAHDQDRPVMSGAYTPTEAQQAHEWGADFIKLFPADQLGASYVKALLAPLPHLRVVPTGGVDLKTAASFLQAGCVALGVGSSLVSAPRIRDGAWQEITEAAQALVQIARDHRRKSSTE